MIRVVNDPMFEQIEILETQPLEVEVESSEKEFTYYSKEEFSKESTQATEELYEKWRELKLYRLDWVLETKRRAKERAKRRKRRAKKLKYNQAPPSFARKTSFLLEVEAYDVAKSEHSWEQGIGCKTMEELVTLDVVKDKRQTRVKKIGKTKDNTHKMETFEKVSTKIDRQTKQ